MKKISICLVVILLSNIFSVFANDTYAVRRDVNDKVINGLINSGFYELVESHEGSYKLVDRNNEELNVSVQEYVNGSKKYIFEESDKVDEVIFTSSGDIFLDGKQVIIKESNNNKLLYNDEISLRAHRRYLTTHCPYGSDSDYYVLYDDTGNKSVFLQKAIETITVGAFVSIMITALFANPIIGLCAGIFVMAYNTIKSRDPRTRSIGARDRSFTHYKGYNVGPGSVLRHVVDIYYDEECRYFVGTDRFYEVFEW